MNRRTHDWDAKTYDRVSDPQTRWGTVVLDRLELRGDERVLDAGCGTARVSELLLRRIPRGRLIALDADPAMIVEARQRLAPYGQRVEFVIANLLDTLPIPPVAAIFSSAALHWIKDHDRLFTNLAAVLQPGGQLVVQCGGAGNVAGFLTVMEELGEAAAAPWYFATPEDTQVRLDRLGFTQAQVWLSDEPTRFDTRKEMEAFVRTSCLGPWLANMSPDRHDTFSQLVAERLPTLELDYVRLNIVARRASGS